MGGENFYTATEQGGSVKSFIEEEPMRALLGGINIRRERGFPYMPRPAELEWGSTRDERLNYWGWGLRDVIPRARFADKANFGVIRAMLEAYNQRGRVEDRASRLGYPRHLEGPFLDGDHVVSGLAELPGVNAPEDRRKTAIKALRARTYEWEGNPDEDMEDARIALSEGDDEVTLDTLLKKILFGFISVEEGNNVDNINEVLRTRTELLNEILGETAITALDISTITREDVDYDIEYVAPAGDFYDDAENFDFSETDNANEIEISDEDDMPTWFDGWVESMFGESRDMPGSLLTVGLFFGEDEVTEEPVWTQGDGLVLVDENGVALDIGNTTIPSFELGDFEPDDVEHDHVNDHYLDGIDFNDIPTPVDVGDNVNAAVDAFTTLANQRHAAEEARLRTSLEMTRGVMTSHFDQAQAILTAQKEASIAGYDAEARLEQVRLQATADMEHEKNRIAAMRAYGDLRIAAYQVINQVSDEALRAKIAEADVRLRAALGDRETTVASWHAHVSDAVNTYKTVLAEADQVLRSQVEAHRTIAQVAGIAADAKKAHTANKLQELLAARDARLRSAITQEEITSRTLLAEQELSLRAGLANSENALRAAITNEEIKINRLQMRIDMQRAVYDTITSWIRHYWTANLGPSSMLISSVLDINFKEVQARRQYMMDRERLRHDLASSVYETQAMATDMRWKSMLQNMMVLKDGLSSIGVTHIGTETVASTTPSQFERWSAAAGLVGNIANTIAMGIGASRS